MEKIKNKPNVSGTISLENNKEAPEEKKMSQADYEFLERSRVWGWENAMNVANDLWASIHNTLLQGDLVFAYKETKSNSELSQIVIVQNRNLNPQTGGLDFGVGMVTTGYTSLLPHVPYAYIEDIILDDLKKYKVDKNILEIYKQIIKMYKK